MDVQFQNNSLSVSHKNKIYQLHPVWLRERLPGDEYFDIDTHQRLYEPSSIDLDLQISSATLSDRLLNIEFNDCLLYTSPSPRDGLLSRMPSSA